MMPSENMRKKRSSLNKMNAVGLNKSSSKTGSSDTVKGIPVDTVSSELSSVSGRNEANNNFNLMKIGEEMEDDNYIYSLHEDIVGRVMREVKEAKLSRERIEKFVDSFCNAWLKLVKWRWMFRDDKWTGVGLGDKEPTVCPKDPWSTFTYLVESPEIDTRSTLPPPKKCSPQPEMMKSEIRQVTEPHMEKAIKRSARKHIPNDSIRTSKTGSEELEKINTPVHILPTAFPQTATGKVSLSKGQKFAPKAKSHVTTLDFNDKN